MFNFRFRGFLKEKRVQGAYLLAAVWLLFLITLPWKGFFLLNDDYFYEWNVRNFQERGLNFHLATAPTTIFQTLLGTMVYGIEADPELLRLLTSFFYFLGAFYLYKLLVLEGISKNKATLLSLLIMLNPLYLYLGFTFMSGTYFLSTFIVSLYFYALAEKSELGSTRNRIISAIFLSFAFLSRQQTLILIPAYLLADYFVLGKRRFMDYACWLIPIGTVLLYQLVLPKTLVYTEGSVLNSLGGLANPSTYLHATERLVKTLYYLGLFSLPMTLPFLLKLSVEKRIFKKTNLLIAGVVLIFLSSATGYFWIQRKELMFYIPNVLTYAGFLPSSVPMGIKQTLFVHSPVRTQALLTLVSIISFLGLILGLKEGRKKEEFMKFMKNSPTFFLLICGTIFSMSTFFFFRSYYDRYMIIMFPLLVLVLGKFIHLSRSFVFMSWVFMFLMGLFSWTFMHDYLSLNKVVWEIPEIYKIEKTSYYSTFEFNEYLHLDSFNKASSLAEYLQKPDMPEKEEYEYFLSYVPIEGYEVIEDIGYKSYISPGFKGELILLKKQR